MAEEWDASERRCQAPRMRRQEKTDHLGKDFLRAGVKVYGKMEPCLWLSMCKAGNQVKLNEMTLSKCALLPGFSR